MEVVSDLNGVLADSESVPEFDGVSPYPSKATVPFTI